MATRVLHLKNYSPERQERILKNWICSGTELKGEIKAEECHSGVLINKKIQYVDTDDPTITITSTDTLVFDETLTIRQSSLTKIIERLL